MSNNDDLWKIGDDSDLRKYRTELPNMTDDDLGPYEYRLYGHYKKVCGADGGTCFESVRTTARKTQMSVGQVVKSRRLLEEEGWITVSESSMGSLSIRIVDRWLENFMRYAKRSPSEQPGEGVHGVNGSSPGEHQRSSHEQERSPGELKNQPIKKQPLKKKPEEESTTTTTPGSGVHLVNTYSMYEDEKFGQLTPLIAEELADLAETYGEPAVLDAMRIAVLQNVRKLSYLRGILERKQEESQREDAEDGYRFIKGRYGDEVNY